MKGVRRDGGSVLTKDKKPSLQESTPAEVKDGTVVARRDERKRRDGGRDSFPPGERLDFDLTGVRLSEDGRDLMRNLIGR